MMDWMTIPSAPEFEASRDGVIRRRTAGKGVAVGRISSVFIRDDGYHLVSIRSRPRYVHRLVCEAFHGLPGPNMAAAHLDGVKANNRSDNLVWATCLENEAHKVAHGTRAQGSRAGAAKLTETQVLTIRSAYRLGLAKQVELASFFGVCQTKISDIVNRKTWRHVQ